MSRQFKALVTAMTPEAAGQAEYAVLVGRGVGILPGEGTEVPSGGPPGAAEPQWEAVIAFCEQINLRGATEAEARLALKALKAPLASFKPLKRHKAVVMLDAAAKNCALYALLAEDKWQKRLMQAAGIDYYNLGYVLHPGAGQQGATEARAQAVRRCMWAPRVAERVIDTLIEWADTCDGHGGPPGGVGARALGRVYNPALARKFRHTVRLMARVGVSKEYLVGIRTGRDVAAAAAAEVAGATGVRRGAPLAILGASNAMSVTQGQPAARLLPPAASPPRSAAEEASELDQALKLSLESYAKEQRRAPGPREKTKADAHDEGDVERTEDRLLHVDLSAQFSSATAANTTNTASTAAAVASTTTAAEAETSDLISFETLEKVVGVTPAAQDEAEVEGAEEVAGPPAGGTGGPTRRASIGKHDVLSLLDSLPDPRMLSPPKTTTAQASVAGWQLPNPTSAGIPPVVYARGRAPCSFAGRAWSPPYLGHGPHIAPVSTGVPPHTAKPTSPSKAMSALAGGPPTVPPARPQASWIGQERNSARPKPAGPASWFELPEPPAPASARAPRRKEAPLPSLPRSLSSSSPSSSSSPPPGPHAPTSADSLPELPGMPPPTHAGGGGR